jgi:ATP-dependent RNA helicase DeaD
MDKFKKLGLSNESIKALEKKGFSEPTPIQELTIPLLLKGNKDVVGKAQTGTGKTACFALPILENISKKSRDVQAIILTPTRELALQVSKEIDSLQGDRGFHILAIYGGASMQIQLASLRKGVQIVVGTPGRVLDLIKRRRLDISRVSFAVLDEADEMLNMGFIEDIEDILSDTNNNKKMLLFSATMPREILKIAKAFMKDFEIVEVENKNETSDLTEQIYYDINARDRMEALHRIIDITTDFHGIIFCKTRVDVDEVTSKLINANYNAAALHGDVSQGQREKILGLFRKSLVTVLVATDVAARGIDVNDLTHVINFSLPQSPESYVHRIGRTGRAGKRGVAITFLIPSERRKLQFIERILKKRITKGTLPSINDIIEFKKQGLNKKIDVILKDENIKKYEDISQKLLAGNTPKKVVSSLLKFIFKTEIEAGKYKEVAEVSNYDDKSRGGKSRRGGRSRNGRLGNGRSRNDGSRVGGFKESSSSGRSVKFSERRGARDKPKEKVRKSKRNRY